MTSAGTEINPMEHLYFRQDTDKAPKKVGCKQAHCWSAQVGSSEYCSVHLKMCREKAIQVLGKITDKVGKQWTTFIQSVAEHSERDDANLIQFDRFLRVLEDFKVNLLYSVDDRESFKQAFIANADKNRVLINIGRLYHIRATAQIRKLYDKVDMYEEADNPDMVDNSGYLGLFYREKKQLIAMKETELVDLIAKNNRLHQIFRVIKDIDRDNNGYVTNQELDDIFKVSYEELAKRDIKPLFKRFASLQNRILIDYKRVKDHLMAKV